MRRKIYKSLDKPSSLFGLKGSYLTWALIGLGGALCLAFMVTAITSGLIGIIIFVFAGIAVYLYVIGYQSRYTERERDKKLSARSLPDVIVVPPIPFSRLSNYKVKLESKKSSKATSSPQ